MNAIDERHRGDALRPREQSRHRRRRRPRRDDAHADDKRGRRAGEAFRHFAYAASDKLGRPWAFIAALSLVIGWAATGPLFHYSATWQLVINTTTTIITFLMVFLIQSSQNRDAKAIHLKLDELVRSSKARNAFADLEEADEDELEAFETEFRQLRKRGARSGSNSGREAAQ